MSVRAFQPRTVEPPQFVAETGDDLATMESDYIGGNQCDGCGNNCYQVRVEMIQPGVRQYVAVCAVDPSDDPEFAHPEPCGTVYRITIWDDDLVTF